MQDLSIQPWLGLQTRHDGSHIVMGQSLLMHDLYPFCLESRYIKLYVSFDIVEERIARIE